MREVIRSSRKIRRRKIFEIFSLVLASVLSLMVYLGFVFQNENLLINKIRIEGNKVISDQEIYGVVSDMFEGRYAWIFPKNNLMFLNKDLLIEKIKNRYSRVKNVNLTFEGMNGVFFNIEERYPKYVWCQSENDCYYADENSLVFDTAPYLSEGTMFTINGKSEEMMNAEEFIGKEILGREMVEKIDLFRRKVEEMSGVYFEGKWKVFSVNISPSLEYDLLVKQSDEKNWTLKFSVRDTPLSYLPASVISGVLKSDEGGFVQDIDSKLLSALRNLEITLNSKPFKDEMIKSNSFPEYIDLRYGKRVFYKFPDKDLGDLIEGKVVVQ